MSKFTTAILVLSLFHSFTLALARPSARAIRFRDPSHPSKRAASPLSRRQDGKQYSLADFYQGEDFFNQFDAFDRDDPTHGQVNYLSMDAAREKGLAWVEKNRFMMKVDDTTSIPGEVQNPRRDSVRISSKKKYNGGLFIADFFDMPHGDSVWPAYWTVGPNWPSGGEIDVLEGVHDQDTNRYTLHTGPGCAAAEGGRMTGKLVHAKCQVSGSDNSGCGIKDTDGRSYGSGFNSAGGGVFAHTWDESGIKLWHFARDQIPQDIVDRKPNPASWGPPAADFPSSACNMDLFHDHKIVINTTLCGDWAGNTFPGGPEACAEYVRNPGHFANAKWNINYVAVYTTEPQAPEATAPPEPDQA